MVGLAGPDVGVAKAAMVFESFDARAEDRPRWRDRECLGNGEVIERDLGLSGR
jgi:hypothetical protein